MVYSRAFIRLLEQVTRIELASLEWKSRILTIVLYLHI